MDFITAGRTWRRQYEPRLDALIDEEIQGVYEDHGGELRCERCGRTRPLKRPHEDWPTCCGQLMAWWTEKDIERGTRRQPTGRSGPRPELRKWDAECVQQIMNMRMDGCSSGVISEATGVPQKTVRAIIEREAGNMDLPAVTIRRAPGPQPNRRKWSPEQIQRILDLRSEGLSQRAISEHTGIPHRTIWNIIKRES